VLHSFAVGVAQSLAIFVKAGAREWAVVQGIRFKLLYGFTGRLDGGVPGNLYGVTLEGGTGGYGVIYELPRALEVNGKKPFSTMSPRRKRTPRAAWFSTTRATSTAPNYGRTYNYGTVFELAHSGKVWTKSVIYSFTGGSDGASPVGGVVFDSAGKLFGVTEASAYELSTVGDAWKETTLFSFNENEINPTISLLVAPSILHRQSAQRRR
jgi:hypothetical protein